MKLVRFLKTCSDILKRRVAVVMGVALAHLVHQKIPVPKIVLITSTSSRRAKSNGFSLKTTSAIHQKEIGAALKL